MRCAVLVIVMFLLGAVGGGYAGFLGGEYVTLERDHKLAQANQCGTFNPATTAFSWKLCPGFADSDDTYSKAIALPGKKPAP